MYEKASLLASAAKTSDGAVWFAVCRYSVEIGEALLAKVTAEARTILPTLGEIDLTSPVAVAGLDADGRASYGRLAELADLADGAREGGVRVYSEVLTVEKGADRRTGLRDVAK